MAYLLNFVYLLLLFAASPWLVWSAVRKGKYRAGWAAKWLGAAPALRRPNGLRLWFHAVSVGEVNLLTPLLCEIEAKHPEWECVISTTTSTGYALAKKKHADLTVFYAPLDFSWAVRRAVRRIKPTALVLVELELWPNLIRAAKEHGAKVAIVNARLGERSFRGYARAGWFVRRVLRNVDLVAAQNAECAARFGRLGVPPNHIKITGSLKFDGAQTDRDNAATRRLRALAGFTDEDIILLAGSTQAPEEAVALDTFIALKDDYPRLKLVLVPRHPHRFDEVAALLARIGLPWQRRSTVQKSGADAQWCVEYGTSSTPHSALRTGHSSSPIRQPPSPILLVDTIGELSAWWGAADIGFVGGSLGNRGGQNMIEPAAYGVATCFGPNTRNFRDIVSMLLAHNAAVVVANGVDLTAFVKRCLIEPAFRHGLGERAAALVQTQIGATAATLSHLHSILNDRADCGRRANAA